eukprot:scaffold63027_cov26-Tisochrysis_lutea.AAC.1
MLVPAEEIDHALTSLTEESEDLQTGTGMPSPPPHYSVIICVHGLHPLLNNLSIAGATRTGPRGLRMQPSSSPCHPLSLMSLKRHGACVRACV